MVSSLDLASESHQILIDESSAVQGCQGRQTYKDLFPDQRAYASSGLTNLTGLQHLQYDWYRQPLCCNKGVHKEGCHVRGVMPCWTSPFWPLIAIYCQGMA